MPVVGRKNDYLSATYGPQDTNFVTKNAPYGNNDSQLQRLRIVGGRRVYVKEEPNWQEKVKYAVESLHACSPISRTWSKQLTTDPSLPSLPPITEKPNNIDPTTYLRLRGTYQNFGDATSPKIQQPQVSLTSKSSLNPHPVIPPIEETLDRISLQTTSDASVECLAKYIPSSTFLASQPITLTKTDELLLKQRISRGLGANFNKDRLKEVYTELVEYDENLTGYVAYTNIGYALLRSQVHLSVVDLRLLSSMYVSISDARKVNYEKVLSFIAACFNLMDDSRKPCYDCGHGDDQRAGDETVRGKTSLQSVKLSDCNRNYNTALEEKDMKLQLSGIDEGLGDDLDFSLVRQMFVNADAQHRGTMSREQIKILSLAAGINMKEHEICRILDKYESRTGAYNWKPYLNEIERTAALRSKDTLLSPRNTILSIKSAKQTSPRQSELSGRVPQSDSQDRNSETKDRRNSRKRPEHSPWFNRFMKMANAFYLVDSDNTGHLPYQNAKWLVEEYNDVYNLEIPSDTIQAVVELSSHDEQSKHVVGIDKLLRQLIKLAP